MMTDPIISVSLHRLTRFYNPSTTSDKDLYANQSAIALELLI